MSKAYKTTLTPQRLVQLVAVLAAASGMVAILQPLAQRLPNRFMDFLIPIEIEELNRAAALFLGFTLIYFSVKLLQRKIIAWWTALVASVVIAVISLVLNHSLAAALIPVLTIAALLASRQQFQVQSEPQSIVQGLRLMALSLIIALLYGTVGFWFLEKRDFGRTFGIGEAVSQTVREYVLVGNPDLIPRTHQARWFLHSLDWLGALSVGFGIYSLFRPLAYRLATLPAEMQEAEAILKSYGNSPDDFFKLWPEDKSYFFSPNRTAFLAYRVERGVAIVLGAPTGPALDRKNLIKQFWMFANASGWIVAFVDVSAEDLRLFKSLPFRELSIGEEALVDTQAFVEKVADNKHFRNLRNRFHKIGYSIELLQPPHQRQILSKIHRISDQWLKLPGRQERGFALGYFSRRYLVNMPLYILKNSRGQIMAFANAIPDYHSGIATIDLMRYQTQAPPNTMDFLLSEIIQSLQTAGVTRFSLGLVPLAGVGEDDARSAEERLLGFIYRRGDRIFSFAGLRRFKDKFEPIWQEKYIIYSGGAQNLASIAIALSRVLKVS